MAPDAAAAQILRMVDAGRRYRGAAPVDGLVARLCCAWFRALFSIGSLRGGTQTAGTLCATDDFRPPPEMVRMTVAWGCCRRRLAHDRTGLPCHGDRGAESVSDPGRCGICWRAALEGPLLQHHPTRTLQPNHASISGFYPRWSSPRPSGWRLHRGSPPCPAHAAFSRRDRPLRVGAGAAVRVCLIRWAAGCKRWTDGIWWRRCCLAQPGIRLQHLLSCRSRLHSRFAGSIIVALSPVMTMCVMRVLLRERWGWLRIVGVATSLFGVTLVVTRGRVWRSLRRRGRGPWRALHIHRRGVLGRLHGDRADMRCGA